MNGSHIQNNSHTNGTAIRDVENGDQNELETDLQLNGSTKPATLQITLTEGDVAKLNRYDTFLDRTIGGNTFPLIFNDKDNVAFKTHREITYAFRKAKKSIYNTKNIKSFEFQVISNLEEEEARHKEEETIVSSPTPAFKWSQVVQRSALKGKASSNGASKKSILHISHGSQPTNIITSNALQPLGIVSLRLMYDSIFAPDLFDISTGVKIIPHGLTNSGNICYMNSVLQMLLYCSPFNKVLKLVQSKTVANLSSISRTPLLDATILFMNEFQKQGDAPLSPDAFYHALSAHPRFSHLKWGQQEDAEEFLGYLLDGLHEEFVESIKSLKVEEKNLLIKSLGSNDLELKMLINSAIDAVNKSNSSLEIKEKISGDDGWHEVGANKKIAAKRTVEIKPSPITLLFGGQFRSVLDVPKQKESKSITLDPFQHVQLDISDPRVSKLEDAFKLLSEPESIPYKSSNGNDVMARKQNFIDKLPRILIIHLKRFSFVKREEHTTYKIEKLRKKVVYSHDLTIPAECISPESKKLFVENDSGANNFKLIGVVYHHGMGAEGGHYTCDVMKAENEWIRIDDGNMSQLNSADVLESNDEVRNAYILMYQKL